jgi:hypothetical protein
VRTEVQIFHSPPCASLSLRFASLRRRRRTFGASDAKTCTTHRSLGNVAQLVEHRLCKAGVAGSNPVVSTHSVSGARKSPSGSRLHLWCVAFGEAPSSFACTFGAPLAPPFAFVSPSSPSSPSATRRYAPSVQATRRTRDKVLAPSAQRCEDAQQGARRTRHE